MPDRRYGLLSTFHGILSYVGISMPALFSTKSVTRCYYWRRNVCYSSVIGADALGMNLQCSFYCIVIIVARSAQLISHISEINTYGLPISRCLFVRFTDLYWAANKHLLIKPLLIRRHRFLLWYFRRWFISSIFIFIVEPIISVISTYVFKFLKHEGISLKWFHWNDFLVAWFLTENFISLLIPVRTVISWGELSASLFHIELLHRWNFDGQYYNFLSLFILFESVYSQLAFMSCKYAFLPCTSWAMNISRFNYS